MVISKNLIRQNGILDTEKTAFLIIAFLHKSGHISREKFMGMVRSLEKGALLKKRNTHHCRINNRWYNDESMIDILLDVVDSLGIDETMTLDEFIGYVNLYRNKPRNWCIDYIFTQYVIPIIEKYRSSNYSEYYDREIIEVLHSFQVDLGRVSLKTLEDTEVFGYCCEDCDGDYNEAKRWRYESAKREAGETLGSIFESHLNNHKTPDYFKNPNFSLKYPALKY